MIKDYNLSQKIRKLAELQNLKVILNFKGK